MKMICRNTLQLYGVLFLILLLSQSCKPEYFRFRKYRPYLTLDSIYKKDKITISNGVQEVWDERKKFDGLKNEFLKVWLDTTNCYLFTRRRGVAFNELSLPQYPDSSARSILDVHVDNILHTPDYDTVLVLVVYYAANMHSDKSIYREITIGTPMKATIDKDRNWHFDCKTNGYEFLYMEEKNIPYTAERLRDEIINWGYFKKDKTPNPEFFHDLFIKDLHHNPPWYGLYR